MLIVAGRFFFFLSSPSRTRLTLNSGQRYTKSLFVVKPIENGTRCNASLSSRLRLGRQTGREWLANQEIMRR